MVPDFSARVLNEEQSKRAGDIREQAGKLCQAIESIPDCREKYLAFTKLEECMMWANKANAVSRYSWGE